MSRIVLYSAPGCHLCDDARDALRTLAVPFEERDASDDAARFLRTPIVEVDGAPIAEGEITLPALRRALRDALR